MTSQPTGGDDGASDEQWEAMFRSMFGPDADEALRQMREQGLDPQALARSAGLGDDPRALNGILAQVQRMLAASGDTAVNADVAHDVARQVAVAEGDPTVSGAQAAAAREALSVADLWLDAATDMPPAGGPRQAWSRAEWVEATLASWGDLAEPVATSVTDALTSVLADQMPSTDDLEIPGMPVGALGANLGNPSQMMRRMGSAVFGMQVGQAAGTLSREVFGATDVGLPLLDHAATVLLPTNVDAYAEGLDAPAAEVRMFLAVRECAHARLFTHVPWLRAHLQALVAEYARGITIDVGALEERVRGIDLSDTDALQHAMSGRIFQSDATEAQKATLLRLETTLALVEGWVDDVTATATLPHLPHAVPLREMLRRRRAAGGPAEQTFATLVGLELRPRRSRDAAALWQRIAAEGGTSARDDVWGHPDLLPDTQDLDDPAGYRARQEATRADEADLDAALAKILDGEEPEGASANPDETQDDRDDRGPDAEAPRG